MPLAAHRLCNRVLKAALLEAVTDSRSLRGALMDEDIGARMAKLAKRRTQEIAAAVNAARTD